MLFSRSLFSDKYLDRTESNLGLMHLGNIYTEMNEYSKSLIYYKRSLDLVKSVNLKDQLPMLYCNLGFTYRKLHKTDSSFFYYNTALKVATEINSKPTLSIILVEMGEAHLEMHDTIIAINFYRNALA